MIARTMKIALSVLLLATSVVAAPPGFVDELITNCLDCTDFTWGTPPGAGTMKMFITAKRGIVWEVDNFESVYPVPTKRVVLDFTAETLAPADPKVCLNGERGFQHILEHPEFATNGIMWIFYTHWEPSGCEGDVTYGPSTQLSRFTYRDGMLQDEFVILRGGPMRYVIHQGGGFVIGHDGFIWLAIGDGDWLDRQDSHKLTSLQGKLLRIDFDGKGAPGNPWFDEGVDCHETGESPTGAPCKEIWAVGLRNPYGLGRNYNEAEKTELVINDVGSRIWEESNIAGSDFPGYHYGWPEREGPCRINMGNGAACIPPGDTLTAYGNTFPTAEPYWYYNREGRSSAITGGLFVPNGVWPPLYDNARMVIDFPDGKVYRMEYTGDGCRACDSPTPEYTPHLFHEETWTVNIKFGPYRDTQAMYVLRHHEDRNIRRIISLEGGNLPPEISVEFDRTVGPLGAIGFTVNVDASASVDPDGDPLLFTFNMGDGTIVTDVADPVFVHTYTDRGFYDASVTVKDPAGLQDDHYEYIQVGLPPTVNMLTPVAGTTYAVKDLFLLTGEAFHGETGAPLADMALEWEMRLHHANHWHPLLSRIAGNEITSNGAPEPEDFWAAGNSHLEVILRATDADGLWSETHRFLYPRTLIVTVDSNPPGMTVILDAQPVTTPVDVLTWENHRLYAQVDNQCLWDFESWSDGGLQNHYIQVPAAASDEKPLYVVQFTKSDRKVIQDTVLFKEPVVTACGYKECGRCEGHCIDDDGCQDGMICHEKAPLEDVPGCEHPGGGVDTSYTSWCIEDGVYPVVQELQPEFFDPLVITCSDIAGGCGICQGHCTSDDDCQEGLVCTEKNGAEGVEVPGCEHLDGSLDPSQTDWCVRVPTQEVCASSNFTFYPTAAPITPAPTTPFPSSSPSGSPSASPSTPSPTDAPSSMPSLGPTPAAPTSAPTPGSQILDSPSSAFERCTLWGMSILVSALLAFVA